MSETSPMIQLNGLSKTFYPGTPHEVRALRDIHLEIPQGQFVTVIGTNGSGKSTLLNALAGSFLPDRGSIRIAGEDLARMPDHARAHVISRVFQNPLSGTVAEMSIVENLHLAALRGQPRHLKVGLTKARERTYRDALARLEMRLEDRMAQPIGTLSGGQRQAVTLLMAVFKRPKVLLLDEHTAALDPKSAAQVLKLTEAFVRQDQLTTLMVTHSMDQALGMGHRTLLMNKGRIEEDLEGSSRSSLTTQDFLDKFARIRRLELLTPEMIRTFQAEYR